MGHAMKNSRMLFVGAEDGVVRTWTDDLRAAGANIAVVGDGAEALRHLDLLEPEIILMDLHLAGSIDGFDTCRAIRARSAAIVVMADSGAGTYDEVVSLAVGADLFLPANTPSEVVIARLRSLTRRARGAVLVTEPTGTASLPASLSSAVPVGRDTSARGRRKGGAGESALRPIQALSGRSLADPALRNGSHMNGSHANGSHATVAVLARVGSDAPAERIIDGDLEIDIASREVSVDGTPVALTRIEFDLLVSLARNPRRVLSREQLMASAWDEPFDGSHVLDAHLSRMRGKIAEAGGERVAHAVRGVGFRLRA
jgi:DNA-binding response OmpR family regulator